MASAEDKLTSETPENKWEAAANIMVLEPVLESDETYFPTLNKIRNELKKNPEFNSKIFILYLIIRLL